MKYIFIRDGSLINLAMIRQIRCDIDEDEEVYDIEYWYGDNEGECYIESFDSEEALYKRFYEFKKLFG